MVKHLSINSDRCDLAKEDPLGDVLKREASTLSVSEFVSFFEHDLAPFNRDKTAK